MEYLIPIVSFDLIMDNYFASFRIFICLPTLELTTFEQEVCSTKIGYANTLSSGTNSCKKRNVATLNSAAHIKQKRFVTCVAGQNNSRALYRAFSESCQPTRNLFGVGTKLKESIFKSNNQINFTVTNRTWVLPWSFLSKEWIIRWPNTRLVYQWKNDGGTRLFEWQMFFFRVRGYYIALTKIKATSLYLFQLFEKMLSM